MSAEVGQGTLFLPEDTYRVSALCEEIQVLLQQAYPDIWVAGEIQRLKESRAGHLYFEMVEKGRADDIIGRIGAVIYRADLQRVRKMLAESDQVLSEGLEIRCRGNLDFYPAGGRLQYIVREVDPIFTLGLLERRRQELLADLGRRDLLDRNRRLSLPRIPLEIGLVTSIESAAYHDFLSSLRESGFGFRVAVAAAAVQGDRSEAEIRRGLRQLSNRPGLGCIVMIRGGGSRSDLAAFDSRAVAEAVCFSPLPVLTGLGHQIDQSVADIVAHQAFKTPTSVADFLVGRVSASERELVRVRRGLVTAGGLRIAVVRQMLQQIRSALASAGPRRAQAAKTAARFASRRLVDLSQSRNRENRVRIESLSRLLEQLSPQRTLRRGFSITRHSGGRALRRAENVAVDEILTTELAVGTLRSRVTEVGSLRGGAEQERECGLSER